MSDDTTDSKTPASTPCVSNEEAQTEHSDPPATTIQTNTPSSESLDQSHEASLADKPDTAQPAPPSKKDNEPHRLIKTVGASRVVIVLFGLSFSGIGLSSHFIAKPNLATGVDAVLFTVGSSLLFHGILLRYTRNHKIFQRCIDYIWYCGAAFGLMLLTLNALSDSELELRQTDIANYMALRKEALEDLAALIAHHADPSLTYKPSFTYEEVKPAPEVRPSDRLCTLAERETWAWIRDEPLATYSVSLFQLRPKFGRQNRRDAKVSNFTTALFTHAQKGPIPPPSQEFCELARREWYKSEWGRVYEENNALFQKRALPSAKQYAPIRDGDLTYTIKIGLNTPPHRFGTIACESYSKLATLIANRNARQIAQPPGWLLNLKSHWMLFLGGIIGFRLLKTTAEVFDAAVGS